MLFRILLIAGAVYFGMKFFKGLFPSTPKHVDVKGNAASKPLDLRDAEVEDAHFEEIKDKE